MKKVSKKKAVEISQKITIGWYEHIDFPQWDITDMKTKIDTGARTSSLHVENVKPIGKDKVRFDVVQCTKDLTKRTQVTERISRVAKVKASPIHHDERYFVMTKMRLGEVEKKIEVNLVDRSNMIFRMILGRTALKKEFVVDVSKRNVMRKK